MGCGADVTHHVSNHVIGHVNLHVIIAIHVIAKSTATSSSMSSMYVLTPFFTCVKEADSCEGKMADLEETKRYTGLESADGSPSDGPGEYSAKMLIRLLWCSADGELPMKSRKEKRIRTLRES